MTDIKIFLSRRCRTCIPIKHWLDANPWYNQYAQFEPPSATVPRLPYLLVDGKAFLKVKDILSELERLKVNTV